MDFEQRYMKMYLWAHNQVQWKRLKFLCRQLEVLSSVSLITE